MLWLISLGPRLFNSMHGTPRTYEITRFTSSGFVPALTSTMSSVMIDGANVCVHVCVHVSTQTVK